MDLQRKDREVGYPDYLTNRRRERDRVPRHESIRLAERELQGRSDAQRGLRRLQGSLREVVRPDPCAEAVKHKRRRLSESAANLLAVSHLIVPRAPSLELYVLPSGGGQLSNFQKNSGAEGDRTPDLCSAIAALSQLSYSPARTRRTVLEQVEPTRRTGSKQRPRETGRGRSSFNLAVPPMKSIPNFSIGLVTLCWDSPYAPTNRGEDDWSGTT